MQAKRKGMPEFRLPKIQINNEVKNVNKLTQFAETREERERINWGQYLLGIPDSWSQSQGKGIKVAVLDTGIDTDHPDLKDAIADSKDFSGDGIEDANGHGTHCAGVIGARMNGVGFVGVAPQCELLIGKVLNNSGSGSYESIAGGIDWAVAQGADIISMSLGGPATEPKLHRAIHLALAEGRTVICAAGNEGAFGVNTIGYPGRYGSVITIAAHDPQGNPAGFSSRGGEIDFMAPGTNIWSTYKDGGFAELSGTSMATPFVAGMAALLLSKHRQRQGSTPINTNEDLRDHFLFMASHPGWHDNATGYGPVVRFGVSG
jgi:subtilisin